MLLRLHRAHVLNRYRCCRCWSDQLASNLRTGLSSLPRKLVKMSLLLPPRSVKEMKVLDRSLFSKDITIPAVVFDTDSTDLTSQLLKKLKPWMLTIRQLKPVQHLTPVRRAVLLNPRGEDIPTVCSMKEAIPDLKSVAFGVESVPVQLAYENWSVEEVLRAVLPDDLPVTSSYTLVGHVAHLNLRETHLPYKTVIGQVILDKHKNIRTVVNKLDNIDNTYRNFQMELLAGEPDFNVTLRENNCVYQFDFSKVYWNSRLGTEHERIVKEVTSRSVVYDVFAGVGPFAGPAAKKGALVYANDLNPESYKWLCQNLKKNKVKGDYHTYNMDGRQFIRTVMAESLEAHLLEGRPVIVLMNLPALAVEFTDAFSGVLGDPVQEVAAPPTVYCYCFSKASDGAFEEDAATRVNDVLGTAGHVTPEMCRRVRNVAPNKEMLCVKFPLTSSILYTSTHSGSKRPKLD